MLNGEIGDDCFFFLFSGVNHSIRLRNIMMQQVNAGSKPKKESSYSSAN